MRMYRSSLSVFMIKIPSGTNRYRKSTEPGSHQTAKIFFFSSFSDVLVKNCLTLS